MAREPVLPFDMALQALRSRLDSHTIYTEPRNEKLTSGRHTTNRASHD